MNPGAFLQGQSEITTRGNHENFATDVVGPNDFFSFFSRLV